MTASLRARDRRSALTASSPPMDVPSRGGRSAHAGRITPTSPRYQSRRVCLMQSSEEAEPRRSLPSGESRSSSSWILRAWKATILSSYAERGWRFPSPTLRLAISFSISSMRWQIFSVGIASSIECTESRPRKKATAASAEISGLLCGDMVHRAERREHSGSQSPMDAVVRR